ncbi:Copper amine oxidase N-terminal domain-containing protein [Paenibacillus sp. 1_12]|uniref:stalk domain-containing protein n=1 Tax=Paenibacillus sp. 1_12 TaxID=1566278 RepID=UPI0008E2CFB0|nr:copper amine oxidase N-terminal domain-containing protein [Paenibacillus sp. 1_12]SFM05333.1 Copper amine oxidase N-terminal domain-containing protein [Paenibacillus sp. 1_12]
MGNKTRESFVNTDTMVHMTTVYTKRGSGKLTKRSFSFVVKGMLISSILLGALAVWSVNTYAATDPSIPPTSLATQQLKANYEDEDAIIMNLKSAVKVIKESGWSVKALTSLMDQLTLIEKEIFDGNGFKSTGVLKTAILETEAVVVSYGGDGLMTLKGNDNSILESLRRIKAKLGISTTLNNPPSPVTKKGEVTIASATDSTVTVFIDGVKQIFPQSALIIDGSTMVPMRSIFEKLGAEISWNGETRTVTAIKGDTIIKLTINSGQAFINGKSVKLTSKVQSVNGNTMVPLRFVSESLGGAVKWDGNTSTAYITSAIGTEIQSGNPQVVNGIKVKFGKHDYASKSQKEYDTVLRIVNEALTKYDESDFGGEYQSYYYEFIDGARWSGDTKDRSDRNRGLKSAEGSIGDLVKAGVSKEEIVKVRTLASIAYNLLRGVTDPKDGSPKSAYDALAASIRKTDCDSDAEVFSLVFDAMNYNTMIGSSPNHAQMYVEIDGNWYSIIAGSFSNAGSSADIYKFLRENPDRGIHTQPTFGSVIGK